MINSTNRKRVEALVERSTKHGQAGRSGKSPTYLIWQSMIGRCHRPTDSSYKYYGAKGVIVCERWRKFENFFEDMGTAPIGTHIHRRNDATIYSKETCEWLSEKEHIVLHNQQRGWGARLNKAQLIDRVVALQEELAERQQYGKDLSALIEANAAKVLAERQRTDHWAKVAEMLRVQLLSALAVIEKCLKDNAHLADGKVCALIALKSVDLSALHERDAKVREPLVEALRDAGCRLRELTRSYENRWGKDFTKDFHALIERIDALAKVKEQ